MRFTGFLRLGAQPVIEFDVAHSEHPTSKLWDAGFVIDHFLDAFWDHRIVVRALVRPRQATDQAPAARVLRVEPLRCASDVPTPHQRIAAYGLVTSERGVLGTQFSNQTGVPGLWGLPGGGIDEGESPLSAFARELAEETAQSARVERLIGVQSERWIGYAPNGVLEDFHALRIIYEAVCWDPSDVVVHDQGGTTARAEWIPVRQWRQKPWSAWAIAVLETHLGHEKAGAP